MLDEKLSIAPMMEWTDPHYRALLRGMTRKTVLYTEMVVDDTIIHNGENLDIFIGPNRGPQNSDYGVYPSVIQLGGSDPEKLAEAAAKCEQYGHGYDEFNLNCGCPSQRVAKKCFGAKLMLDPELVRQIVSNMQRRVSVPITVKCRIGADEKDSYDDLTRFINCARDGGVRKFIIHSRKCFLNGLTTKQNRDIPPLKYEVVHRLVRDFPDLNFVLNGGIQTFEDAKAHINSPYYHRSSPEGDDSDEQQKIECLPAAHGIMIGRTAFSNPMLFATADSDFFGVKDPCLSRREVLEHYIQYCEWCQSDTGPFKLIKKNGNKQKISTSVLLNPMRNVITGLKNTNAFRKALNDLYVVGVRKGIANPSPREVIEGALSFISDEDLDAPQGNAHIGEDIIKPIAKLTPAVATATASASASASPASSEIASNAAQVTRSPTAEDAVVGHPSTVCASSTIGE